MGRENAGSTDFTDLAWETFYDTVDSRQFRDEDAALIYEALSRKLRYISFGDYLKRYIYRKAGFREPFEEVTLKDYQQVIADSFYDRQTPRSFEQTSARLSALSRNWLTQKAVKREVVLLLGFGLNMSADDVNSFLTKALRERGINARDPFEVICWYCYRNGYSYPKFETLLQAYRELPADAAAMKYLYGDRTVSLRRTINVLDGESSLFAYLAGLKQDAERAGAGSGIRNVFEELYLKAKETAAELLNSDGEPAGRKQRKHFSAADVTESDLERILCSAIPLNRHGNLTPCRFSDLSTQFAGKRFSRQHLSDITSGRTEITRFDFITLNFFIYSQDPAYAGDAKKRFIAFVDRTNEILDCCAMGQLYVSNPYECFVLMCILSEDPLGTYADVWERSYSGQDGR